MCQAAVKKRRTPKLVLADWSYDQTHFNYWPGNNYFPRRRLIHQAFAWPSSFELPTSPSCVQLLIGNRGQMALTVSVRPPWVRVLAWGGLGTFARGWGERIFCKISSRSPGTNMIYTNSGIMTLVRLNQKQIGVNNWVMGPSLNIEATAD